MENNKEEFKFFFEKYQISNLGNCRKKIKNGYQNLKGSVNNRGYLYIQLIRNGKRLNLLFHQYVAKLFIGDRPNNMVIDHIDRNKLNNQVYNLRYVTQKENCQNTDRYIHEIKEQDLKKRSVLTTYKNRQKIRDEKKYICDICPKITPLKGIFGSKRDYDNHMKSKLHIWRKKLTDLMKLNDIEINKIQFKYIKDCINDYNRGRRKTKPLVYLE